MDTAFLGSLAEHYHGLQTIYAGLGIAALSLAGRIFRLIPAFGASHRLNSETLRQKMERPAYADNQRWNRKWGGIYIVLFFGLVIPFTLTAQPQSWSKMLLDIVVILFVYDFFYYLMHRFLFHDSSFLGGPLKWMHAVHHRQHNPCRQDSSYIHPLEVGLGLGLFVMTIFGLSFLLGNFSVVTFVITWMAFSQINLHNHTLWEADHFPFQYMSYLSRMHHNHHARFTGGNFATISLLYDWMFGTLDHGRGLRPESRKQPARSQA
ncbi:MAG: sterol desaturase family protein [Sphingomonadales bacterium]|nr:sterol desaturase family protein [Sphingomonadales bacterium]